MMSLSLFLSAANFLYFTFHLLDQNVCEASVSLHHRDGKFKYAYFRNHLFHTLDVPKLEGAIVPTISHCLLRCVRNYQCFSTNTTAFSRSDGNISCDLLPTDKYSAPEKFRANHSFHHYSILTPCEGFPYHHGGTCQPLYDKNEYHCNCTRNFTGQNCETRAFSDVKELAKEYQNASSEDNKAYFLKLRSVVLPVYCLLTNDLGECGGGGWVLVMKIDGLKKTFTFNSSLWSNVETFNPAGGETGLDSQETKLPTYWDMSFSKISLGMKVDQQFRSFLIHKSANSLHSLIADGQYRKTVLGRETWKSLIGLRASLQENCNMEGFDFKSVIKATIGFISNDQPDCQTCDSQIGFGLKGKYDKDGSCGNTARYVGDHDDKHIKAMGYIFVQ